MSSGLDRLLAEAYAIAEEEERRTNRIDNNHDKSRCDACPFDGQCEACQTSDATIFCEELGR